MEARAYPEPAAAAEQYPARFTQEEAAQAPAPELAQTQAELGQEPAQVLAEEPLAQRRHLAQVPALVLAEAASRASPEESASSKKPNSTACSGCSHSLAKPRQPRIRISTLWPGD